MLEQIVVEQKPSFMQRTKDFLRTKKAKVLGAGILAAGLMLAAAKKLEGQTTIQYANDEKDTVFIGTVLKGDYKDDNWLKFVLEVNDNNSQGQKMLIEVEEKYSNSTRNLLENLRGRINNPVDYPLIKVIGEYYPDKGSLDGIFDPKIIESVDSQGIEEAFLTDPYDDENYRRPYWGSMDYLFFPGSHLGFVHYPFFGYGFGPSWDWDMDGIPNWMDPYPTMSNNWNWVWFDPWAWSAWDWGFGWNMGWGWNLGWRHHNWNNSYWDYWGGWNHYTDPKDPPGTRERIFDRIRRDQLQDPHKRIIIGDEARNYLRRNIENKDLSRIVNHEQLNQIIKGREGGIREIYDKALRNPSVIRRDESGRETRMRIEPQQLEPGRMPGRMIIPANPLQIIPPPQSGRIRENVGGRERVIKKDGTYERNSSALPQYPSRIPAQSRSTGMNPNSTLSPEKQTTRNYQPPSNLERRIISPLRDYNPRTGNSNNRFDNTPSRIIRPPTTNYQRNQRSTPTSTYRPSVQRSSPPSRSYSSPSRSYSGPSRSYSGPSRSSGSSSGRGSVRRK